MTVCCSVTSNNKRILIVDRIRGDSKRNFSQKMRSIQITIYKEMNKMLASFKMLPGESLNVSTMIGMYSWWTTRVFRIKAACDQNFTHFFYTFKTKLVLHKKRVKNRRYKQWINREDLKFLVLCLLNRRTYSALLTKLLWYSWLSYSDIQRKEKKSPNFSWWKDLVGESFLGVGIGVFYN